MSERWPNQVRAIEGTVAAIERGVKRLCVTSPTGSGKTRCMTDLIEWAAANRHPVALYTKRKMLYDQTCRVLDKAEIRYGKRASGHDPNLFLDIQMCMTPTENSRVYKSESRALHRAKIVIVDECFPAGTLVSGVPIELLKVGDMVDTHLGLRRVATTYRRRRPERMLRLRLDDGRQIVCTPEHPVWTPKGFIAANELTTASMVLTMLAYEMPNLWLGRSSQIQDGIQTAVAVQQSSMQKRTLPAKDSKHVRQARRTDYPIPSNQRYAPTRGKGAGVIEAPTERIEARSSGRQRKAASDSAGCASRSVGLANRTSRSNQNSQRQWLSNLLQNRHWKLGIESWDRGRWWFPFQSSTAHPRRKKRGAFAFARVVDIEVLEQGSGHGPSEVCPDGYVYNLETAEAHTYFAEGVLVHNCHQHCGPTDQRIIEDHVSAGAAMIGYTATPLDLVGVDELLIAGTMSECLKIGALVKPETYAPDEPDLRHIKNYTVGRELTEGENVKSIMRPGVFARVFEAWKKHNPDAKPTLLFGPDVAGSLHFAEDFCKRGVPAAHIDGEQIWINGEFYPTDDEHREWLAGMSKSGDVKVVCNRFVLREGIDWPWIEVGSFATVFGSLTSFLQSGGRLLRAHPDKSKCVILDHGGNWHRHGSLAMDRHWELGMTSNRVAAERQERMRDKKEPEPITCPSCAKVRSSGATCPACGFTAHRRSRVVIQVDGKLKHVAGEIYKPRQQKMKPNTQQLWDRMYYRARSQKWDATFRQAEAMFFRENFYWPPRTLNRMPREPGDWFRKVSAVPQDALNHE